MIIYILHLKVNISPGIFNSIGVVVSTVNSKREGPGLGPPAGQMLPVPM